MANAGCVLYENEGFGDDAFEVSSFVLRNGMEVDGFLLSSASLQLLRWLHIWNEKKEVDVVVEL